MNSRIVSLTATAPYIFALCEDGSVWRKSIHSEEGRPWERFG